MMIESMVKVTSMNAMIGTTGVEIAMMIEIIMIEKGTMAIETTMMKGDTSMI